MGIANALLRHLSDTLPISRWQRDLTVATVLRNMGTALGYALIGYDSLLRGLGKIDANPAALAADLDSNWEVLAEPIQTVMRRYGVANPYEQLKALTRGTRVDAAGMTSFVHGLDLPEAVKQEMLTWTPGSYTGLAAKLAKAI